MKIYPEFVLVIDCEHQETKPGKNQFVCQFSTIVGLSKEHLHLFGDFVTLLTRCYFQHFGSKNIYE